MRLLKITEQNNFKKSQTKNSKSLSSQILLEFDILWLWIGFDSPYQTSLTQPQLFSYSGIAFSSFFIHVAADECPVIPLRWRSFLTVTCCPGRSAFQICRVDGGENLLNWNLNAGGCLRNAYGVLIYWCSALVGGRVMEGSKAGKIYLNLSPKPWLYSGQCSIVLLCFVETSQKSVWQCCLGTHWNLF